MSESMENPQKGSLMNPEPKRFPDFLRSQFNERESYTYGTTTLEAVDIKPEVQKEQTPVFFGAGWNASRDIYETAILGIVESGRRVKTLFAPHGIDTDLDFGKGDKTYAAVEMRKAVAMLRILENTDTPIDIVAHSEAGIWTLIVATMHPDKIRNIVLVNPAGLIGQDSLARLVRCFCLDIVRDVINAANYPRPKVEPAVNPLQDALCFLKNVAGRPLLSLKEVLALSNADTRSMLQSLKAQGKHIAVVHSADDDVFPSDRMAGTKDASGKKSPGAVDLSMVHGFYSVYGKHSEINHNPEAYAYVINHALNALGVLSQKDAVMK